MIQAKSREPIHRWCSFSDSWPPAAVEKVLSLIKIRRQEWVWDPFVGAGTTALVARTNGLHCVASDLSPLAVLVARTKINPPSTRILEAAKWDEALSPENFMNFLRSKSPDSKSERIQLMRFLLVAAMLRTQWHLGRPFDERKIRAEYSRLMSEMLMDQPARPLRAKAHIFSRDFRESVPFVRRVTKGKAILIASPPFIGSNDNPRLLKLSRGIGFENVQRRKSKGVDLNQYRRMLDCVVGIALEAGCRAVAVELSARRRIKDWPPMLLSEGLKSAGYSTTIMPFNSSDRDPSVICLGFRTPF